MKNGLAEPLDLRNLPCITKFKSKHRSINNPVAVDVRGREGAK